MILYTHYGIFHALLYTKSPTVWILISVLQLSSYVTMRKPLNLCIIQLPYSYMKIKMVSNSQVVMSIVSIDKW